MALRWNVPALCTTASWLLRKWPQVEGLCQLGREHGAVDCGRSRQEAHGTRTVPDMRMRALGPFQTSWLFQSWHQKGKKGALYSPLGDYS